MSRAIDILTVVLLLLAASALIAGMMAIGAHQDIRALYFFVVGALALRAGTELLRSRSAA